MAQDKKKMHGEVSSRLLLTSIKRGATREVNAQVLLATMIQEQTTSIFIDLPCPLPPACRVCTFAQEVLHATANNRVMQEFYRSLDKDMDRQKKELKTKPELDAEFRVTSFVNRDKLNNQEAFSGGYANGGASCKK